jgi:hypothetical protein
MEWGIQNTNTQEMLLVLLYVNGVGHSKNKHTRDAASSPLSEWSGEFKKQTHKICC